MSFSLQLNSITEKQSSNILNNLIIKPPTTQYDLNPEPYYCYRTDERKNILTLPLNCWSQYTNIFPNPIEKFDKMNTNVKFVKQLLTVETDPQKRRRDQDVIVKTALERLYKCGNVFMSLHTGAGKTALAIYLSIILGLKTVILSHLNVIKQQWIEEYDNFSGGTIKVQFLNKAHVKLDPTADVYIIGIQKACLCIEVDFSHIGTVIIDEAHIVTVTAFTQTLFKFQPRYLIGLSATPDRPDRMEKLFYPYFGDKNEFIVRHEKKPFVVYKVETEYEPIVKYMMVKGKKTVNWNSVIQSIEENEDRWELIADIVMNHPKDKIIVLCNRKILSNGVYNVLLKRGEDVELLIEQTKKWNKSARVLVSSFKKSGVGYNDPDLTLGIIASDTKDARQYEGRIRTVNNIIYHIVDNYNPLHNHYKKCEQFYVNKGAVIEHINKYHIIIRKYYKKYLLLKFLPFSIHDIKDIIFTEFMNLII